MIVTESLLAGALLVFVVVMAALTAVVRDVLSTILVFGVYSLGLAMLWNTYRAPDVALTEAAVGVGVTTALFLIVVGRVVRPVSKRSLVHWRSLRPRALAAAGLVVVGLGLTIPALPAVGAADTPAFGPVAEYYLTDSGERGIDNAVTAVLVVYRGFDTFGEVTVVFAAAVAVLSIFRQSGEGHA